MEFREHLLRMLDYEIHANNLWLGYLETTPEKPNGAQFTAEAEKWLWHIAGCHRHWFNLLTGTTQSESSDLKAQLAEHYARAREFITNGDLTGECTQSHPDYGTWKWSAYDVVLHVLNHSSYHRGHVRAIAEAHNLMDWPDSDWDEFSGVQVSD